VSEYHIHLDKKVQHKSEEEVRKMERNHINLAQGLIGVGHKKLTEMLENPEIYLDEMTPHALIRMIKEAALLERISRGVPAGGDTDGGFDDELRDLTDKLIAKLGDGKPQIPDTERASSSPESNPDKG
jgi:hypothetical protein